MDDARAAVRAAQIGSVRRGRALTLSLARVLAFSGGPFDEPGWPQRNLHTDVDHARAAGLDRLIASGTQSEGLLIGFLIDTFGSADWYRGGMLDVRFVKSVNVGDTVRPALRWTSRSERAGALHVTAECWCELENGERVVDGTAACSVRLDPTDAPHAR
jgi:acyl dehydratase